MKTQKPKKSDPFTPEEVQELIDTLQRYEAHLENADKDIAMKGKLLGDAQREQASLAYFYGVRKAELGALVKRIDTKVSAIRGRLHRWYKENDSLNSSERQIDKYVDQHEEFLTAMEVYLYADEVYKKYIEVDESFIKRGFAIRDFTEARIKEVYKDVI